VFQVFDKDGSAADLPRQKDRSEETLGREKPLWQMRTGENGCAMTKHRTQVPDAPSIVGAAHTVCCPPRGISQPELILSFRARITHSFSDFAQ
jgi:hypothetical protein